jgi:hypothetical protein
MELEAAHHGNTELALDRQPSSSIRRPSSFHDSKPGTLTPFNKPLSKIPGWCLHEPAWPRSRTLTGFFSFLLLGTSKLLFGGASPRIRQASIMRAYRGFVTPPPRFCHAHKPASERRCSDIDLERAVGGDAVALLQTGDKVCTGLVVAVVPSQVVGGACAAG